VSAFTRLVDFCMPKRGGADLEVRTPVPLDFPAPSVRLEALVFSDGSEMLAAPGDVVVIVGPSGAGKSATLRGIVELAESPKRHSSVVKSITLAKHGTYTDVVKVLDRVATKRSYPEIGSDIYEFRSDHFGTHDVESNWHSAGLGKLTAVFIQLLSASDRLAAADPVAAIALTTETPAHPIHRMQRDESIEGRISRQFRKAFGEDLVLHRSAGKEVPLYVGQRPVPKPGHDRVNLDYALEVERLQPLELAGDGMRSFAGIVLYAALSETDILLIDEPEAFLHPPQAKFLGRMLVAEKPPHKQLLLATHSGDFLRGVLESDSDSVKVIRIRRDGNVNRVSQLDHDNIRLLWSDPILRYSNILDGLFHEMVIVTEGDSDAQFYAAVLDAVYEAKGDDVRKPDIMFTYCGGKPRLPVILRSLRSLDVPVACVTDFDVLRNEDELKRLVEAAGGVWNGLFADWKIVVNAIEQRKPVINVQEAKSAIGTILDKLDGHAVPARAREEIRQILRQSSSWETAKNVGKDFLPSGVPTQACDRLLTALRSLGVFVVPHGEMEGFVRSVGNKGPRWVSDVMMKDLCTDAELADARAFVETLVRTAPRTT